MRQISVLRHWGVQLRLAYSWARTAISANVFISSVSSLSFIFLFLSCPSLLSLLLSLLSLFSHSLVDGTKCSTRTDMSLNPNTINKQKVPQKSIVLEGSVINYCGRGAGVCDTGGGKELKLPLWDPHSSSPLP